MHKNLHIKLHKNSHKNIHKNLHKILHYSVKFFVNSTNCGVFSVTFSSTCIIFRLELDDKKFLPGSKGIKLHQTIKF